mgnify:CR=1 FL=1
MGILYVVATPIGNLGDISSRALEVLRTVYLIYAEDTRVTKKLLSKYEIHTRIAHYDEHVPNRTIEEVMRLLNDGKNIAVVSDAGTPGISDPGSVLVSHIQKEGPNSQIQAIPGPSAVISALSVSGISANKFTFLGYPPQKNKRNKFFEELSKIETRPIVLYESPHRLKKTLKNISELFGLDYVIFISKEITKIHETNFTGTISEALDYFEGSRGLGEFVIIIP